MNQKNLIGIVTVLFNSDDVLPGFFESLARQKNINFLLYVIDNSKTESGSILSRDLAAINNINIKVIFNNANYGVAKGNNQGIELARNDGCNLILLANNDIEFYSENLIEDLVEELKYKKYGAVVPKIYYYGINKKIWFAGGELSIYKAKSVHFGLNKDDLGEYDKIDLIEYAPTCFMLINSNVFDEIGVMDEKYFVYYDDTDFVWRLRKAKIQLGFISNLVIQHKVSYSTGGDEGAFSMYYMNRNRLYFIRKHYDGIKKYIAIAYSIFSMIFKARSSDRVKLLTSAGVDGMGM